MKKSRFSAEQIVAILNEAAAKDMKVAEVCRKHGITEQTYYRWCQHDNWLKPAPNAIVSRVELGAPPRLDRC